MKRSTRIALGALAAVLVAGAAGGGYWWWQHRQDTASAVAAPPKPKPSTYRYVTLDKVIVMLRAREGDPMAHYMAVDLVFQAEQLKEKSVKEQLPLLRSVAVHALSSFTVQRASTLSIEELARELNAAYSARYLEDGIEKPFVEVMIGKLIVE